MLEPLDAKVVDRSGSVIRGAAITYSSAASDSVLTIRDGRAVQCRNDGVSPVVLSSGGIKSTVMVHCDIIENITAEAFVCTRLGDAPIPLSVAATDRNGNAISNPRIYVTTDSSFLRVKDGLITPLKAGDGDIDFTNGRRRAVTLVRVLDTAKVSAARVIHARDKMFAPVCAQRFELDSPVGRQ